MNYLSAPYTHVNPDVVNHRMATFLRVDLLLSMRQDHTISPLHKTSLLTNSNMTMDMSYQSWQAYCRDLLKRCDSLVVIMLEGWDSSVGVMDEINMAKELNIPIRYFDPIIDSFV